MSEKMSKVEEAAAFAGMAENMMYNHVVRLEFALKAATLLSEEIERLLSPGPDTSRQPVQRGLWCSGCGTLEDENIEGGHNCMACGCAQKLHLAVVTYFEKPEDSYAV